MIFISILTDTEQRQSAWSQMWSVTPLSLLAAWGVCDNPAVVMLDAGVCVCVCWWGRGGRWGGGPAMLGDWLCTDASWLKDPIWSTGLKSKRKKERRGNLGAACDQISRAECEFVFWATEDFHLSKHSKVPCYILKGWRCKKNGAHSTEWTVSFGHARNFPM